VGHRLPLWGTAIAFVAFCVLMYGAIGWRDRFVDSWRARRGLGEAAPPRLDQPDALRPDSWLERQHVGHLRDDRAVDERARGTVAPVVVNEKDVAERAVDDVEAHVRRPLVGIGVVLQQRVEEIRVEKL